MEHLKLFCFAFALICVVGLGNARECYDFWTKTCAEQGEAGCSDENFRKKCQITCNDSACKQEYAGNCKNEADMKQCEEWRIDGECEKNESGMTKACAKVCGFCDKYEEEYGSKAE